MAPRSKERNDTSSGSESESDAPEAISLSQSKKNVQKLESSRQNAIQAKRQSKRVQNQQRDKALKERAEKNKVLVKGKGKGKEKEQQAEEDDSEDASEDSSEDEDENEDAEGADGLEARMRRAMKEAQDEQIEADDEEDEDLEEYEGFEGLQMDEDAETGDSNNDSNLSENDDDDEESDSEAEEDAPLPPKKSVKSKFNPDHLPDEIFAAAFASQSNTKRMSADSDTDAPHTTASRPSKKRKPTTNSNAPKDVVVGLRAIRILPTSSHPKTPSTAPSRKIKQFLDRTLALKAGRQRGKGWERRPVNIGILRRGGGPAANFVRNQTS